MVGARSPCASDRGGLSGGLVAGESLEQGPEEKPFVDGPSRALVAGEDRVEPLSGRLFGSAPEAEHPREPVPRLPVRRHRVHLSLLDELEAVLDGTEEPVRERECGRVLGCDVPGVGELGQAGKRGPQPEGGISPAVHQLQQLDGELHVPDPAAACLELAVVEASAGDDGFGPRFHGAQLAEVVRVETP